MSRQRYLCATTLRNGATLAGSILSLELQEAVLVEEIAKFDESPYAEDAVRLGTGTTSARSPGSRVRPRALPAVLETGC